MADLGGKMILIRLDSDEGRRLLQESRVCQQMLLDVFQHQEDLTHCGIQSLALVLIAAECGRTCTSPRGCSHCAAVKEKYHGYAMLDHRATAAVVDREGPEGKRGVSLEDMAQILVNHGREAAACFGRESTVDEFRRRAVGALRHGDCSRAVIVNFQRFSLGQTERRTRYGHHSPLAAYHDATDRFLLLDTNKVYPLVWLNTAAIFEAMKDIDVATGKCRGYVIMGTNI